MRRAIAAQAMLQRAAHCCHLRSNGGHSKRYLIDTIQGMAMTLRLTDDEQEALRQRAALDGTSMQEAARRAVREYVTKAEHRDRVAAAAELITDRHADVLRRLGE